MSSSRRRRVLENDQALDHISNLPDSLLSHILSFIPTKSSVKTSILSKRWKSLWTKVPTLDFSEMPCSKLTLQQKSCFTAFVRRVLLHNDVSYVGRLCLWLRDVGFDIRPWLVAITRRQIERIDIRLDCVELPDPIPLPKRLLSSEKLVKLQLAGNLTFEEPTSLHLPNLEAIILCGLQLPNDEFMKRLLSGCPALKELCMVRCSCKTNTLYVESLTLETLKITRTKSMNTSVGLQPRIVIKAPNLRYLTLEDALSQYEISDLNSLLKADLILYCYKSSDEEHGIELVRKVSEVKTLRLFGDSQLLLVRFIQPPVFQNLTHLELETTEVAFQILMCAPNLVTFIVERADWDEWDKDDSFEVLSVPECLSCLENVELGCFRGQKQQINVVAYFLKEATRLKEMKIHLIQMSTECEIELIEELLMLPRSSPACQVKVQCFGVQ